MSQQDIIAAIVKEVLAELNGGNGSAAPAASNGRSLNYKTDYPLAQKRRELVKTATGKTLDDITLDAIMSGAVKAEEIRITPQTLEYQAQIAESISRPQLARNMRRAGELTNVPDERVLGMYNALRPNRSSKAELLAIADELESQYGAKVCANFVREAAGVYEARDVLKKD
ncbi:MAG: diol dehydratase small subunit [Chloroflexi bacterium]|nr:diol dehydratase small subunit [Chloroflexota bacterium]MBK7175784.1 diol dehydratase small subunit [Chloroflexota bacterium]